MFRLEALPAKHGDSLLLHFGEQRLIVIDGGPSGVYTSALRPRLEAIRKQRRLAAGTPLDIELAMVSHIDADHITGLLEMTEAVKESKDSRQPMPWRIKKFWHNSFDDTVGGSRAAGAAAAATADAFSADAAVFQTSKTLTAASVKQGRDLAKLLPALSLEGNPPFRSLVQRTGAATDTVDFGTLQLTIVGPNAGNVELLRKDWAEKVVAVIRKEKAKASAIVADYVDRSPYNLSSIVVLARCDGKSMLLTGDGRGDHTLDELDKAGLIKNGKMRVDLLKLPHHGSSRNVAQDYFDTIHATHYVVSADGRHSNPDVATLAMISKARPDDDFTIYLTYPYEEYADGAVARDVRSFFEKERARGRRYGVKPRPASEPSISVSL